MNLKKTITAEIDLLTLAAETLKQTTGIAYTIMPGDDHIDARIVLEFPGRRRKREFTVEFGRAPGQRIASVMEGLTKTHILVANYINPNLAERLKKFGIQFMDCAGNAYLNTGATFLYVKGNKLDNIVNDPPTRLFKPGGLQVLFVLLCNPDWVRAPYREIATKAEVALGTVAWAIKDLQAQGYIIEPVKKTRRLVKREALLRLWLVGYEQLLRPRLFIKRYHAEKLDWWMAVNPGQGLWGGEVAAYKMTKYLKPEIITLYAPKLPDALLIKNRLRLDPKGEIEVIEPFWNFEYPEKKDDIVPPLLVYADLMVRADGRITETAKLVYEQYLARYIKEN
jgi:hypothetical protein